jgi:hypothetical protein
MAALSGQKTVAAAGTAVVLGTIQVNAPVMIKALPGNTNTVYVGNDGAGDVTSSNGCALAAGDAIVMAYMGNLGALWVDAAVGGEGVSWLALDC